MFLSLLFWVFLAAYVVHILDETLINGGFVRWIADDFWPTYNNRMFFYGVDGHLITMADFAIGTTVGVVTIGAFLTVGPTVLFPRLTRRGRQPAQAH